MKYSKTLILCDACICLIHPEHLRFWCSNSSKFMAFLLNSNLSLENWHFCSFWVDHEIIRFPWIRFAQSSQLEFIHPNCHNFKEELMKFLWVLYAPIKVLQDLFEDLNFQDRHLLYSFFSFTSYSFKLFQYLELF